MSIPKLARDYSQTLEKVLTKRGLAPELPLLRLKSLNKIIWGVSKQRLMCISARPSHGKSSLAMCMAYDLALQGHSVLFLSIESTPESVLERLFCCAKRVNNRDLLTGKFSSHKKAWEEFLKELEELPLVLDNSLGRDIKAIDEYLVSLPKKPDVVIIDHIQDTETMAKSEREGLDKYIRHIRYLAIEHNFAVVACSQQNRASQDDKDKRPKLHQIKGSGGIEQISDTVLLLYYEGQGKSSDYEVNQKYEIHVAKNRDGITGYINHTDIIYYPWFYSIEDKQVEVPPPTKEHETTMKKVGGLCMATKDWYND